ncbi:adenovirus E1B 19 kDa protein-interacting 3-like [Octopus vulgaris]|uniref:Adenovirus E1B 19 kDa protein-interacting 3-like n=1 Tax=Octopus vulgaris TaxID=6645 RepID=A0AA36F0C6_OCTVU|nr:adenovirus E1B 19 kDa protein-interacting 3-like [Octopus vulgaris]
MADNQFSELDDDLTGSWVELCHQSLPAETDTFSESIHNGNMEKLLMEAQQESCSSSQANSAVSSNRGSPKISNSPKEWATHEMSQGESVGTDWIWDWSSRPEIQPVGMFMYLKKYCNWAAVIAHHALD